MVNLESNQTDFIKSKAAELVNDPKIARVVEVYEHLVEDDNSNFEADVIIDGGTFEERAVPYNGGHSDSIAPPKVGDKVLIDYMAGENNHPVIMDTIYTNKDRAPVARSGMYRDKYEAGSSPVGDGDLYMTGYTTYDDNPAKIEKSELSPEETFFQVAKQSPTPNPAGDAESQMRMEMYDSEKNDAAHIRLDGSQIDGDSSKGISLTLDFKSGDAEIRVENSNGEFGVKLNAKDGSFKVLDQNGYGITSDGNGSFDWYYQDITYHQNDTTSL